MTLLEFANHCNIKLLPYQKKLVELYDKARREGKVIKVFARPNNGKDFLKVLIEQYEKHLKEIKEVKDNECNNKKTI